MQCGSVEERLSEYIERTLPHAEMVQVAEHLQECPNCLGLLEEMRSILITCRSFPEYEAEPELIDRILLRTSGRTRTRSFRERFRAFVLKPTLTPRFAVGVGLALLFVALSVDLIRPHMDTLSSVFSTQGLLLHMDRGIQSLYSEGLKLYSAKNEWQSQIGDFMSNMSGNIRYMIEKLDVPVEGKKKPAEQKQDDNGPSHKSGVWLYGQGRP